MGVSLREYLKYGEKGPTARGTRTDRTRVAKAWSSVYWKQRDAAYRQRAKWRAISASKKRKREEISNARKTNALD